MQNSDFSPTQVSSPRLTIMTDTLLDARNTRSRSNALTARSHTRVDYPPHISITLPKNRVSFIPTRRAHLLPLQTTISNFTLINSTLRAPLTRHRSHIHISPRSRRPSTDLHSQTRYLTPTKVPAGMVQLSTSLRFIQDLSHNLSNP